MEVTKESLEKEHLNLLRELFNYVQKEEEVADFETWADQNSIEKGNFIINTGSFNDSSSMTNSQQSKSAVQQSVKQESPIEMEVDLDEVTPKPTPKGRKDTGAKVVKQQQEKEVLEVDSSAEYHLQEPEQHDHDEDQNGDHDLTQMHHADENDSVKSIMNIEDSVGLKSKLDVQFHGLPPNYTKIYPAKVKKQQKTIKGYHLLASKLKVSSKPLTRVIPTANKSVSTMDWKVIFID